MVVLMFSGCALIQQLIQGASWKEGTIVKVGHIFGAKEWTELTYGDGTILILLSATGNSEWYEGELSTVYYEKIMGENVFVEIVKGKHSAIKYE